MLDALYTCMYSEVINTIMYVYNKYVVNHSCMDSASWGEVVLEHTECVH